MALTEKELEALRRAPSLRNPRIGAVIEKPKAPPMREVIQGGWTWREGAPERSRKKAG